ncbi:hypothetical protein A0O28_0011050 [Trichoderma guizhouense]|uniref:RING-type E3 ubiquitin transferase n=1 Tax=Trichoderma guizhouense TaxID=1491466 RepID=A0A1T3CAI8_9HYPO|nr:hypothetical protein A0O28_0011050 [Trichoderma guizhouense]
MDGSSTDRHLDANAGREVVYCHACAREWYRDERGLLCPRCGSDITEIVSPDNDPRDLNDDDDSEPESPPLRHRFPPRDHDHEHDHNHDHDSDPDEADIEEHLGGPNGFHFRRSVRGRPGMQHHDPNVDPVIERFLGMIQDFQPPRRPNAYEQRPEEGRFGGPHIHRATFTNGSGSASVTIFSGTGTGLFGPGPPGQDRHGDPFQTFFSNVLRDVSPPVGGREAGGPTPGFARGLQEILNLFNPAHAIAGDAVYSQEALDQIITNLMEAHPQSNAAPPASNEALANLDRKPVDASMLEGESKTECTICIDDMKVGDPAAFLPCKHWFHEECVTLWLKEHNTCPVCRASIEKPEDRSNPNRHTSPPPISTQSSDSDDLYGSGLHRTEPLPIPGAGPSRPPNQSQSRLNEAMRGLSSQQEQQDRESMRRIWGISGGGSGDRAEREQERDQRERERDRIWGAPSAYDTWRAQRRNSRNSLSPTSPRLSSFADYRVRPRQSSPPQSSRRERENSNASTSANPSQPTSSGPLSWLRERFSGGGSRDEANREER